MAEFPVQCAAIKGDVDSLDELGMTALHLACQKGIPNAAEFLLDNGACVDRAAHIPEKDDKSAISGFTALHFSAREGREDCVKLLLRRGANVHLLAGGRTALHHACDWGFWQIAEHLLKFGADVNVATTTFDKCTPLHGAAGGGCPKTVELLLSNGAKVDALNGSGDTPLYQACILGRSEAVQVLVRSGASVNHVPPNCWYRGLTPLEYALNNRPSEAIEIITKQLVKMESQGLFICEGNLRALSENERVKSFAEKCRAEIKRMPETAIRGAAK